jgi:RHS repeat-associated protein
MEQSGTKTKGFLYDEAGLLIGFSYQDESSSYARYFYIRDQLGHILGLVDGTGEVKVRYTYDAWGNILSITGSLASTIGQENPFRYKGYYYDSETGYYYCQSRYYVPIWCRWLSSDKVSYLDIESINGINLYMYCGNNPVMCADITGLKPEWLQWLSSISRIVTGIVAVTLGMLVMLSGVAGIAMLIIAGVTIVAGALTLNNGIADTSGLITGYNYMSDGLFQGNEQAYNWYAGITEAIAIVGSAICGGWLKYNAPRIRSYKNVGNYNYTRGLTDVNHMSRPWANSIILQKNVIKYGTMTKDSFGYVFEIMGTLNGTENYWRLGVNIAERLVWHWGFGF